MSKFGKVEVTSTLAESSFFKALALLNCKLDFIITYILNLDIPPKILRGLTKDYFWEKHCFLKKRVPKYGCLVYTTTLYMMVDKVKGGGRRPPHQPRPNFPSWWNVRQKVAIATLCVLCACTPWNKSCEKKTYSYPEPVFIYDLAHWKILIHNWFVWELILKLIFFHFYKCYSQRVEVFGGFF